MRSDMAKVIVENPRRFESECRKGRLGPLTELPAKLGLRRYARERGGWKRLNENLSPLRRYMERQVGRRWDDVYSEICANLRPTSTVQQHVRDHVPDLVDLGGPQRRWWRHDLFVDGKGYLRRRPPQKRTAKRPSERTVVAVSAMAELHRLGGIWFWVDLATLPAAEFRAVRRPVDLPVQIKGERRTRRVEVVVHQLITPAVQDIVTGRLVAAGPETDTVEGWKRFNREHPRRVYAVAKRQLCKRELRRFGLSNVEP